MSKRLLARAAILAALACQPALAVPPSVQPPVSVGTAGGLAGPLDATLHAPFAQLPATVQGLHAWRAVGRRAQFGPPSTPYTSNGYRALTTWRAWDRIAGRGGVTALRVRYCNAWFGVGTYAADSTGGEVINPNPITISAGLEVNGNAALASWTNAAAGSIYKPYTFGGQAAVTIPGGRCAESDPLWTSLTAGQAFYTHTTCNEPVARTCPANTIGNSGGTVYDGDNSGYYSTTLTGNGSTTAFSFTAPAGNTPIVPGSLNLLAPGASVIQHDDGGGNIVAGNGIASGGTVNYSTGVVSWSFTTAPGNGVQIFPNVTGGPTPTDQSGVALGLFATTGSSPHPNFGPHAILGLPAGTGAARIRAIGWMTDSLGEGNGNSPADTSWIDYTNGGLLGVAKGAASGEELRYFASPFGHASRAQYFDGAVDRILADYATNDFNSGGQSLSQVINSFLLAQPTLVALTASGSPADMWYLAMPPRTTNAAGTVPLTTASGPYTASGAAYGPGAVAGGVQVCTVTGTGGAGPYGCTFSGATMIGSVWSDGALTSVTDSGAGGTGATTLTGSGLSTGTHTPSTGAVSLTFSAALATGSTVKLYAYLSGPSARNAWNHWLYNWALPQGLIGGVIDLNPLLEAAAGSSTGSGNGQWKSGTLSADGTHFAPATHQTLIPAYIGPGGSNPSAFWTIAP